MIAININGTQYRVNQKTQVYGAVIETGSISAADAVFAALAVQTADIANLAVTTAKIQDLNVTNVKIANTTIEFAKTSTSFSKDTYLDKTSILVGVDALLGYSTYGYVAGTGGSFVLKKSFVQATEFGASGTNETYMWGYKIQSASTNPRVKFKIRIAALSTIADRSEIGLREVDDDGTLHGNGMWVVFDKYVDSTLRISGVSANGSAQTSIVLQTFTVGTEYTIEIEITSGTSVTFFVNGINKGTISGYAPTGTLCDFYFEICSHASAALVAEIKKWKLTDDW
jgi:hypothetical protein